MIQLYLSVIERTIVEDIQEIGYGELYQIELDESASAPHAAILPEKFLAFFKELRSLKAFETVIIHDSQPQYAIFKAVTENGRSCLKRIKF